MAGGTQVDVYNLALAHLGTSARVQNIGEDTAQAGFCNQFWDRARKIVLEQGYWSFATRAVALALVLDQQTIADPSKLIYPGWRYIYRRPNDCLKAQAVTTYLGIRTNPNLAYWWRSWPTQWGPFRPPWLEALDYVDPSNPGQAINVLSDQDSAWLIYTTDPPNVSLFSETMLDCISWQLAVLVGGPLSASAANVAKAEKEAPLALSRALAQNTNEQQTDPYPDSPSIQARR